MQISSLIRSRYRFAGDLARAADVVRVLVKYGLASWMSHVDWEPARSAFKSNKGHHLSELPLEERVRLALTELGTTFIKLGQMLSTRPDLVGQPMADELSKLQTSVPPDPPAVAIGVVEAELGRPISECFDKFEPEPTASASIGQVHAARLKNGRRVMVKVQHPGIEGVIRRDLDILAFLAHLAEQNEEVKNYQPVSLIKDFSRTMLGELDFRRETRNLVVFRRNFADDPTVIFPKPYPELSTGRVLTMDRLRGFEVTDDVRIQRYNLDRAELAKRGATVFVQMIFRDGFYHADPHPGNFLVMPDGRIGLLDAGMVGRIDDQLRNQIEDILMAAGERDSARLTDTVTRLCGVPRHLDRATLSTDLMEVFHEYGTQAVGQMDVGNMLTRVTDILHHHKLILPSRVSMLIKCLVILEGTGRLLSPTFNLAELLAPWRGKLIRQRYSLSARFKKMRRLYSDLERMSESIPRFVHETMDRLEHGKFAIRLEHRALKSAVDRLVAGIFVSSLLLASSILIVRDVPPLAWQLSILGMIGYTVALVFGVHMLWVYRDKNKRQDNEDWD